MNISPLYSGSLCHLSQLMHTYAPDDGEELKEVNASNQRPIKKLNKLWLIARQQFLKVLQEHHAQHANILQHPLRSRSKISL